MINPGSVRLWGPGEGTNGVVSPICRWSQPGNDGGQIRILRIFIIWLSPEARWFSAAGWRTRSCCRPSAASWCSSSSSASPHRPWRGWGLRLPCCTPPWPSHWPRMPCHTSPWSWPRLSARGSTGPGSGRLLGGTEKSRGKYFCS